ncbi:hypothetical protein Kisp01_16660 [Kineosporia sp. NBRC 101677]|uniref:hypothetical protein n=1 Tax=Kineosporia sp. NBRC 101677 TaxID=3032197 RepID=UPI0024A32651|nr:hypothetical protein [Kineosporia sp. NBRC 101677]GLY14651.1 hypothetical protein Kisp01_16660 [Kineosporia sp. NBRC 101677]
MLSPTHEEAAKRLERLADRLRVVGPRLGARQGAEAAELLARIRAGLQRIADLTADADGEPRREVPVLSAYALADQALVLGHDLLRDGDRTDLFRGEAVAALQDVHDLV